jgi:hypothetical protein
LSGGSRLVVEVVVMVAVVVLVVVEVVDIVVVVVLVIVEVVVMVVVVVLVVVECVVMVVVVEDKESMFNFGWRNSTWSRDFGL